MTTDLTELAALDREMATEVMGWTSKDMVLLDGTVSPHPTWVDPATGRMLRCWAWHPTTDANQALEVLEKWLIARPESRSATCCKFNNGEWAATLQGYDALMRPVYHSQVAPTLPLAICRAVSQAVSQAMNGGGE